MRPQTKVAAAGSEGIPGDDVRYAQELSRSLKVVGNIAISLSAVTPASSVFIIAPAAIIGVGTGAFLAYIFGALIGVLMAFCWAELSAAFPVAGGDYGLVARAMRGPLQPLSGVTSFVTFGLMLVQGAFIPAVIALGTADYLGVIWSVDPKVAGAVVMLLSGAIAILNIRLNAVVTGVFLTIEILALLALTLLGLFHWHRSPIDFIHNPVVSGGHGTLAAVAFGSILTLTATAIFSYNGYNAPVFFAEETRGSSRGIARAVLWSLVITVAAELIPITAVLIGAPSLDKLTTAPLPLTYFIKATSNTTTNTLISLGVAIAIINAVIAIVLQFGRILYSSGRDRAWPGPVSDVLATVHPRLKTPIVATALVAVVGAVLCLTVSLGTMIRFTGASLVASYALVAVGALAGRLTGATTTSSYRMPLWPLPPLLAIAALVYVATQQTHDALRITAITIVVGIVYWLVFVLPRRGRAWIMRDPVFDDELAP